MENDPVKEEEKEPKIHSLRSVLISVFIVWLIFSFGVYFLTNDRWEEKGQFGDMFGFVNSLFSGLAFAGLIYTIFLQKNELHLQRVELRETREVFKDQSSLMETQRNISIFFNMIDNHRILINSLSKIKMEKKNLDDGRSEENKIVIRGYDFLQEDVALFRSKIGKINELLKDKKSNYKSFNENHPSNIFSSVTNLSQVFISIKSIITFINKHLGNLEMYHDILFIDE